MKLLEDYFLLLVIFMYTGSSELAAVGVSVSVFNLVSKLFNVPLLNITTSFVAEEQAMLDRSSVDYHQLGDGNFFLVILS